ncbi:YHS domain-containing protein [Mycobacterium intracellulare]|nr:YHS domain-containing protein [Mycobacterium intracellulare]
MQLHPDDVAAQATWRGRTFAFCSQTCAQAFDNDPDRFDAANM